VEKVNGRKEKVYTAEVKTREELATVIEAMKRNLNNIFGTAAEMTPGKTEVKTMMDHKDDGTTN